MLPDGSPEVGPEVRVGARVRVRVGSEVRVRVRVGPEVRVGVRERGWGWERG